MARKVSISEEEELLGTRTNSREGPVIRPRSSKLFDDAFTANILSTMGARPDTEDEDDDDGVDVFGKFTRPASAALSMSEEESLDSSSHVQPTRMSLVGKHASVRVMEIEQLNQQFDEQMDEHILSWEDSDDPRAVPTSFFRVLLLIGMVGFAVLKRGTNPQDLVRKSC